MYIPCMQVYTKLLWTKKVILQSGMPPASKNMFRGQRVSTISAILFDRGLLDCRTVTDTVTGEQFGHFVRHDLSSHLHAFDGTAQEV